MLSVMERRVMDAVVEQEAGDFLRAMNCWGPSKVGGSHGHCVLIYKIPNKGNGSLDYHLRTECRYNGQTDFHLCFSYTSGYRLMLDSQDELDHLTLLTLEATRDLCTQIIAAYDSIEESTLNLLPLYREACEEIRRCPEEVPNWLLEPGLRYHAAKNFLKDSPIRGAEYKYREPNNNA